MCKLSVLHGLYTFYACASAAIHASGTDAEVFALLKIFHAIHVMTKDKKKNICAKVNIFFRYLKSIFTQSGLTQRNVQLSASFGLSLACKL